MEDQKEGDDAKLAYKQMLDHFLNEIDQVDQKTPSYPPSQNGG